MRAALLIILFLCAKISALAAPQANPTGPANSTGPDGLFQTKTISIPGSASIKKYQQKLLETAPFAEWKENCGSESTCQWQLLVEEAKKLESDEAKLEWIHRKVRIAIEYTKETGNIEQPQSAQETMELGHGDCEDFAILYYWLLEGAGVDPNKMHLVLVGDRREQLDHAVLAVQVHNGTSLGSQGRNHSEYKIIDNRALQIYSGQRDIGIRPAISLNKNGFWVHGHRLSP